MVGLNMDKPICWLKY